MTFASVRAAAQHLAKAGTITPHQLAALTRLDERLKAHPDIAQEFTDGWRTEGSPAAAVPSTALVSMAQATTVFTRAPSASQLADLNACLSRFQITTPDRIRQFLAQVGHESGGLRWLLELASGDAYEGRSDLGNTRQGDGRRFKGGGAIQLTGRYNYQRFADFIEDQDVMEGAAYVATTYPFTSAGFWWHLNAMNAVVDQGATCRQVSARVNGRDPANGLADREVYYARAVKAIPQSGRPAVELQQPVRSHVEQPAAGALVCADGQRRSRTSSADVFQLQLRHAAAVPEARHALTGPNGDDQYLARVQTYGDTTDATAQVRALASFGIKARFVQSAGWADIEQQIATGIPVPCGFLHRGPVTAPGGGGHWLIVVGFTPTHLIVHDPFGEADLVNGTTLGGAARFARYSYKNFGPRWMVEGPGTGWAVLADR
jgi:predicted chitinase